MKVYRGPRTSKKWKKTDAKSLKTWVKHWRPGSVVALDGTIDKLGQRHTDLGIEIESHDIVALNRALAQYQATALAQLEKTNAELEATIQQLERALKKINALASYHRSNAPTPDALADAVAKIADHFAWSFSRKRPLSLKMRWVKWKSL
jgi:hypothetical protein